jgi:hypothetical protein
LKDLAFIDSHGIQIHKASVEVELYKVYFVEKSHGGMSEKFNNESRGRDIMLLSPHDVLSFVY